jgi:hypothetical protein
MIAPTMSKHTHYQIVFLFINVILFLKKNNPNLVKIIAKFILIFTITTDIYIKNNYKASKNARQNAI